MTDLVLGLSRIPLFTTYLRIPPSVWKMGLSTPGSGLCGTTFPVLDVDFLQEIDVLTEYVVRANKLGWGTRQQVRLSQI